MDNKSRRSHRAADREQLTYSQSILLIALMWGAYFLNYSDRIAIFSMFQPLRNDLGFQEEQLGLIGSIFLWVYGISCPIAGQLADRLSKRWMVIGSLIIWSAVTLLTGLSTSIWMLLILRAFMGISEAMYMPAAVSLTADAHSTAHRSLAVSTLTTAQIAGTLAGAWFGGVMAQRGEWRSCFYIMGLIGIVYAIPLSLFLLRIPERRARTSSSTHESSSGVVVVFRVATYRVLCVTFPVFVFGLWMLYSWLPDYIRGKFNLDTASAGFLSTIYFQSAMLIGLLLGGWLADRLTSLTRAARIWLLAVSIAVCAPCLHLIGASTDLNITCAATAVFGLFGGFFAGNIFPAAFEVVPANSRASAVGWLNFFGALLSGFAPLLGGMMKKNVGLERLLTYTSGAYLLAATGLVLCICFLFQNDFRTNK